MTGRLRARAGARPLSGSEREPRAIRRRALLFAALAALLAGSLAPALARADGDPASDVLLSQPAFVPPDSGFSAQQATALNAFLHESAKAGFPARVAIIPEAYDLGYVTQLWAKPRSYAEFLGVELSLVFKGPLIVVMPDGFGFNWPGHSTASAYAALSGVAIKSGSAGLLAATRTAVRRAAGTAGVQLGTGANTSTGSPRGGGSNAGAAIILIVLGALAAASLLVLVLRRRRASAPAARSEPPPVAAGATAGGRAREPAQPYGLPLWLCLAIPGAACLLGLAIVVPLALRSAGRSADAAPSTVVGSPNETAPVKWPQGARAAPGFTLTDQHGRPVSIADYRGHPLIVTFIDPLCRELCPLAAQVLSRAERQLPASEQPEVIAVSVNIYGNARANLLQDYSKWNLTPQWRWAIGTPRQLASVWKRYYEEVDVTTKHIAGTTVHYLAHSEMAYVIDPNGYERALLLWPYTADQVENAIHSVQ
jgi:protein SCO1